MTLATVLGCIAMGGIAHAESYRLETDPSGAKVCFGLDGERAPIEACEGGIRTVVDAELLSQLPDGATQTALQFMAAVDAGDAEAFAELLHPRSFKYRSKKLSPRKIRTLLRTRTLLGFLGMPSGEQWNVRVGDRHFGVFRGSGDGPTAIAYFRRFGEKWRLYRVARMRKLDN